MSKNFFKVKKGLNVDPVSAASITDPEVGDIIVDSSDNNKLKRYDDVTASWKDVGSGVGGINYISTNSDFEGGTTGYVVYKDAAAESPVDATSGTALYTSISATTSSPLRGTKSGLISKTANDAQGEGVSYDFTIDSADQAQVLRISFDYSTSTNYADGDIRVYVYDVFNSRLIEVIDRDLYASSFGKFVGTFQTSPDSTSYRLIFHIASTNALAYTVTVDNVLVGPQTIVKGAIVTDWKEFTPEINQTTNITPTGYWRRVGSNAEFSLRLDFGGAVPSTSLIFVLPNSLSIDYSKIVTQTDGVTRLDSTGQFYDASAVATANAWDICAFASGGSTAVRFIYNAADDFRQFNPASAPVAVAAGDILTLNLKVPILGWSSNVVLSEDAGNREIVASAYLGTAANHTSSGSALLVPLDSELFDTTSSFDSVTSKLFTVPESGYYDISGAVSFNSILTGFTQSEVFINGVPQIRGSRIQGNPTVGAIRSVVSGILLLNKGDTIGLYATQNESASEPYVTGKENTYLHIAKRSSPQTIAYQENPAPHKNYVINGNFDFWQRGTSLTSGTGGRYLADRFRNDSVGSTYTTSRQSFTVGQNEVPNNPSYFHRTVVSSVAGASNIAYLNQRIEGVGTLSNKQITLSFWAKADSNKPITIEFTQYFGSGGTPSTTVTGIGIKKVNLTTSWQKITHTVYIPSIAGKTLGTNENDLLNLLIWFDAGSTYDSRTDSLGQQSGTFDIAQVQIEEGSRAREFVLAGGNIEGELAACQRYYESGTARGVFSSGTGTRASSSAVPFRTEKRATPVVNVFGTYAQAGNSGYVSIWYGGSNDYAISSVLPQNHFFCIECLNSSTLINTGWFAPYTADSEL